MKTSGRPTTEELTIEEIERLCDKIKKFSETPSLPAIIPIKDKILLFLREFEKGTIYAIAKRNNELGRYRRYQQESAKLIEEGVVMRKKGELLLRNTRSGKFIKELPTETLEEAKKPIYRRIAGQRPRKGEKKYQAVMDYALQQAQNDEQRTRAEIRTQMPRLIRAELDALAKETNRPRVRKEIRASLEVLKDFSPQFEKRKGKITTLTVNQGLRKLEDVFAIGRKQNDGRLPVQTEIKISVLLKEIGFDATKTFLDEWKAPYKCGSIEKK